MVESPSSPWPLVEDAEDTEEAQGECGDVDSPHLEALKVWTVRHSRD